MRTRLRAQPLLALLLGLLVLLGALGGFAFGVLVSGADYGNGNVSPRSHLVAGLLTAALNGALLVVACWGMLSLIPWYEMQRSAFTESPGALRDATTLRSADAKNGGGGENGEVGEVGEDHEDNADWLLGAICRNYGLRTQLYEEHARERKKYAEMRFDIYRHELEFRHAMRQSDSAEMKRDILANVLRDKMEWYQRKFFEYVENIKGKYSRKGFLYPAVLDDFQELWCELHSCVEIIRRAELPEITEEPIKTALNLADEVVYRVTSGKGIKAEELEPVVVRIGQILSQSAQDFPNFLLVRSQPHEPGPPQDITQLTYAEVYGSVPLKPQHPANAPTTDVNGSSESEGTSA